MAEIDPQNCADLVRAIADRIAAEAPKSGLDASLADLIGRADAVSEAAERTLRESLTRLHPNIGWTGEQTHPAGADYWLYDPVDGAYHYLQGLPLWSSSLVLVRAGRPVVAIIYDPTRNELFMAKEGGGATCGAKPMAVSPKSQPSAAVVGTAVPPLPQAGAAEQTDALALLGSMSRVVFAVRPMAAASLQLAYVAAGRLDAYWETGRDAADWLAGSLLVREAGGTVTDLQGDPFGWSGDGILAGNANLHAAFLPVTNEAGRRAWLTAQRPP